MSESENSNNCEYEEPEMLFVSLSQHFSVSTITLKATV